VRPKQSAGHGVSIPVSILQSLKWINRHGTACALLALFLLFCIAVQTVAVAKITILSDIPVGDLPPRLVRNMAGIRFIQANGWFALPYLLLSFGTLIYMEIRATPRWAVWSAFAFLALPIIGYLFACMRVVACFMTVVGRIQGP
jgi:hypothetical protein